MSREVHVQFCERAGVRLPCATHLVVVAETKEILESIVKPAIQKFLAERGPRLSEEKTVITHIQDGFDFLGKTLRKFGTQLISKRYRGCALFGAMATGRLGG